MAILRIDRFTVEAADAGELVKRRNALVEAVRLAVPGLLDARLARLDDRTWVDLWRWDSRENAQAAVLHARGGALPEAAAAFALTRDVATELLDLVDER